MAYAPYGAGNELDRWATIGARIIYWPAHDVPTVEALTDAHLRVSWTVNLGTELYELWRSTSESEPYEMLTLTADTAYEDTYVTAGTRYLYKLRGSFNSGGARYPSSDFSPAVAGLPLRTPSMWVILARSGTSLDFTLGPVPGADGVELWRSDSPSGEYVRICHGADTSFTDTGLSPGVPYYYQARAYKTLGDEITGVVTYPGPWGAAHTFVPLPAPEKPYVVVQSGTAVRLSWDAVPGADGYELWTAAAPLMTYTKIYYGAALSYTDTGLTPGVPAYYKLRPIKSVDGVKHAGYFSGIAAAVPLSAPNAPSAAVRSSSSVRLNWFAMPEATGCELWRAVSPTGKYRKVYVGTALNFTDSGLTGGTAYSYKLCAYKQLGTYTFYGPFGSVCTVTPRDQYRPPLPIPLLP